MRRTPVVGLFLASLALLVGCSGGPTPEDARITLTRANIEAKKLKYEARGGLKPKDQPQEAIAFFNLQRLTPGMDGYPIDRLEKAVKEIRTREATLERGATPVTEWQPIGPGNIGGRTRAIVINPNDPNIMYAGGVAGGVWKTLDAGQSWFPTSDTLINLAVSTLAMDPTDPDVIYAGTGEGFFNGDAVRGLGIFKTTDGAKTWERLPSTSGSDFYYVNKVEISPAEPSRVFAATRNGVFRSTDGGENFEPVLVNPAQRSGFPQTQGMFLGLLDLEIRPGPVPEVILATAGSFSFNGFPQQDGLWRSDDGGNTWARITGPLARNDQGRMNVEFAPSNPDVAYAVMATNGNPNVGEGSQGALAQVFRSDDAGQTWTAQTDLGAGPNRFLLNNLPFSNGCVGFDINGQGWYDLAVAVDPLDEDILWVGGIDLFRSDDAGRNFGLASYWYFDPSDRNYVHADHHELVFHPDYDGVTNQTLFSGSDGGVARTDNARGPVSLNECPFLGDFTGLPGVAWRQLNNGYAVTQFYHGDADENTDRYLAGAQDNGTSLSDSADPDVPWREVFGGDGGYVAINPQDPDNFFVETQNFPTMRVTFDGGLTFQDANGGIDPLGGEGLFINPFAMDPNDPTVLWTGGFRPFRTTNSAASWLQVGPDFFFGETSAIAIAPSNSNVVYFGSSAGFVARTTNALAPSPDWDVSVIRSNAFISWIAVDPTDPMTAYATSTRFGVPQIYKTTNGGASWTATDNISAEGVPDIPVHCIAIRPNDPNQLFAGTELGVFFSGDAGVSWQPVNNGLANTVVETLDFVGNDRLVAFTHGRSAFATNLAQPTLEINTPVAIPGVLDPMTPETVEVEVVVLGDTLVDGPTLSYREIGSGAMFTQISMNDEGLARFTADLPGFDCGTRVEFFVSAQGASLGQVRLPESGFLTALAASNVTVNDSFEAPSAWTAVGSVTSPTSGAWTFGAPEGNGRGDPADDADGTGLAFLTGLTPGEPNSDVDGGTAGLLSPFFATNAGGVIAYSYWLNDAPIAPLEGDTFTVSVSQDGADFEVVRTYTSASDAWREDRLIAGQDFEPSPTTRVLFEVTDGLPTSIVEAGVDAFRVITALCSECLADINEDGQLSGADFNGFLTAFTARDPAADQNLDGQFSGADFNAFLTNYLAGCPDA